MLGPEISPDTAVHILPSASFIQIKVIIIIMMTMMMMTDDNDRSLYCFKAKFHT